MVAVLLEDAGDVRDGIGKNFGFKPAREAARIVPVVGGVSRRGRSDGTAAARIRRALRDEPQGVTQLITVRDEVVGQLITYLPLTLFDGDDLSLIFPQVVTGFVLFRLFDVWKPGAIRWAERRFKGGLGVMADDVVAGLYASFCLVCLVWGFGLFGFSFGLEGLGLEAFGLETFGLEGGFEHWRSSVEGLFAIGLGAGT